MQKALDALPEALDALPEALTALADPAVAAHSARYFQAGPSGYGEGDRFLGIRVPDLRTLARAQRALPLEAVLEHLRSPWHEERLVALLIMVEQHRRGSAEARGRIHRSYLEHARFVNGWDLVDTSAEHLVGPHVDPADPTLLDRLAGSDSVWERRIAMMATFHWTRKGVVEPALRIADRLKADPHDLIQKAVGWMVREVGKRDPQRHEAFLAERYRRMPRTMLRTAIERLPEARRQSYLRGEVAAEEPRVET